MEAMALFRRHPRSSRLSKKQKTWTGTIVCLANKNKKKIPTAAEKSVLFKCGLGQRRITMRLDSNTEDFILLMEDEFPQLKNAGGFECLRCSQNCRDIAVIESEWNPLDFRNHLGAQAKIYLRPIQRDLLTTPVVTTLQAEHMQLCIHCNMEISVRDLRKHMELHMFSVISDSDSEVVLPDVDHGESQEDNIELHPIDETVENLDENRQINEKSDENQDSTETTVNETELSLASVIKECIDHFEQSDITNPVEILKYLQMKIVTGRQLDIVDTSQTLEGETNFILVNREDLLNTSFDEIENLSNLRLTLQVDFYGETAQDFGGPRKEFFMLALQEIQKKYLETILDSVADEYKTVGKIYALSILQNGKMPVLDPEIIEEVFQNNLPRPALKELASGLDSLGLLQIGRAVPSFLHLIRPRNVKLTYKKLVHLLKPDLHEIGSNTRKLENKVYSQFLEYIREAASGRRGNVSLNHILLFATGTDEEPALGYYIHPSIQFSASTSFLPTANTCINRLNLPRPASNDSSLPEKDILFNLYDYAFANIYFGLN